MKLWKWGAVATVWLMGGTIAAAFFLDTEWVLAFGAVAIAAAVLSTTDV